MKLEIRQKRGLLFSSSGRNYSIIWVYSDIVQKYKNIFRIDFMDSLWNPKLNEAKVYTFNIGLNFVKIKKV